MPPLRIFFYLLLDKFDQNLVTWISLTIGLSRVWRWIEQLNFVRFGKCRHLLWYKWRTLICCQSLWNIESMNNMLCNKLNHISMYHILQRNYFGPFSKIIHSNQHEAMPLWRWRINLPTKFNPQPRNGHGLIIGCINAAGTNYKSPNRWHSSHPL